ncbi:sulfate transporter, partial [Plakobranchus ocellatus]
GLAYGLLANLTPISGVYTSIFSVLVYVVFGTVPHMSMGTNAVLSLITATMVEREADRYMRRNKMADSNASYSHISAFAEGEERMNIKLGLAMTSTFLCGLILLSMGFLRMGFLTNYMSTSFVNGFTSAAALHIAISQMKHVFHIKIKAYSGLGKLVFTVIDVMNGLRNTNIADTIVCIVSASELLSMNYFINPKLKELFGFMLPSNLFLVIAASVLSYIFNLHAAWNIAVVGKFDTSLPMPGLPLFDIEAVSGMLYDSLTQAVIIFTMSISMAMLMAKLHSYELDSNRELVAYGACNLCSSFFTVQSSSVSPPRTMILSNSGARTTFNGVSTVIAMIVSIRFVGWIFWPLPLATLAAMIIVAVMDVFLQIKRAPVIWRISRTDFVVWISTWLSTVFADLEYGIIIGILISAFGFMFNNQNIKGELVVLSTKEDLLLPGPGRASTRHLNKTRVFYFPSQLFFANAESFKRQLYKQVFNPTSVNALSYTVNSDECSLSTEDLAIDTIILDCSAMTYIDIDGLNMLKNIVIQ